MDTTGTPEQQGPAVRGRPAASRERRVVSQAAAATLSRSLLLIGGLVATACYLAAPASFGWSTKAVAGAIGLGVVGFLAVQVRRGRVLRWLDRRASWIAVLVCAGYWFAIMPDQGGGRPSSGPYQLAMLAAGSALYPLVAWVLLTLSRARSNRLSLAAFCLDELIVSWAAGMVLWHLLLYPVGSTAGATIPDILLLSIAPSADVGLLLLAWVLIGVPMRGVTRRAKWLLLGALVSTLGSDLAASIHALSGSISTEMLPAVFQAWFWVAAGWITLELGAAPDVREPRATGSERLSFTWLPYAAIAIAFVVPAIPAWGHLELLQQHVPASIVLIALVLGRLALTARQNAELVGQAAERRTQARFRALVQNASDLILLTDPESHIRYATPSSVAVLGLRPDQLDGARFTDRVHPEDAPKAAALLAEIVAAPGASRSGEWRIERADGSYCEAEVVLSNLIEQPEVRGLVFTARDIGERITLERQLTFQALHDPLTGLGNRALFADRVEHALARVRRRGGNIAVIFLDLDDFKRINDAHGHGTGDRLLVAVASRLASVFRTDDTVARLGGDEFAALLENLHSLGEARRLAERVVEEFRAPFELDGIEAFVTASVGIAFGAGGRLDPEELLRNADVAMYVAKANGKQRCETYDPSMHRDVRDRLILEAELRRAVEADELEVHYQPVWSTGSRQVVGVEALVRWRHPTRGLLAPAAFIGVAEETGLIVPIGRIVLRAACAQIAAWDRAGLPRLSVAVNLSPRQLRERDLLEMVSDALADSGLSPTRLDLEITEAVLVDDSATIATLLTRLKELGVRISIDDFGTGYSSLSYLQRLPIDTLKIAKPFVDVVTNGSKDEALAQAIVTLARSLELSVIAEGVEHEEQLAVLAAMGCELGQGFLVSPPLPAKDLGEIAAGRYTAAA